MAGMEHVISVEELLSRKVNVVKKEAGETSRDNDQPIIAADKEIQRSSIEVQVTEKASPRKQRLEQLEKAGDEAEKTGPKIQKVPFLLRGHHKDVAKYFEPRMVSLGPIHHGNRKYKKAEKYKLRLANKFIKESGADKKAESLYAEIEKNIKQLREHFDEEVTKEYDDEFLAWMLFVDGCAVLQFIYCAVADKFKDLNIKNDQAVFGQDDLFLLENQLPYQLLKDLMKLSKKKKTLKDSINRFIDRQAAMEAANCNDKKTCIEKPAHLLDRLRTRLLIGNVKGSDNSSKKEGGKSNNINKKGGQEAQAWHSFRNVQELRAAGIQLEPTKTSSLRDITFDDQSSFYPGYLYLPQITVDDSTRPKFLNLIAYEMCPDFDNDFGVTSYICFLHSLIDLPDDVKELRKALILRNLLGSDKAVSKLFNDIATDLVPNPTIYGPVKREIQKCCDRKWKTWLAQFIHDHFSAPWSIVTFLVSIVFTVILSLIQTWYAAQQTGYAAKQTCYAAHPPPVSSTSPYDDMCKKLA